MAPEDDDGNTAAAAAPAKIIHTPTGTPIVAPERMSIIADVADAIKQHWADGDLVGAFEDQSGLTDSEERTQLWKLVPANIRAALKKHGESLKETAGASRA